LLVDFPFQELIDVDSEVVFELASYILQVSCSTQKKKKRKQDSPGTGSGHNHFVFLTFSSVQLEGVIGNTDTMTINKIF
jgi:hypothetical protein